MFHHLETYNLFEGRKFTFDFDKKDGFWGCNLWIGVENDPGLGQYEGIISNGRDASLDHCMANAGRWMRKYHPEAMKHWGQM